MSPSCFSMYINRRFGGWALLMIGAPTVPPFGASANAAIDRGERCRRAVRALRSSMAFDPKVLAAVRTAFPGAGSAAVLPLGAPVHDGQCHPEPLIGIPLAMMNRHGLVAGATGTGKTKTLQLMTEGLSAAGVPVFVADIKGDLSGMAIDGEPKDFIAKRAADIGQEWAPASFPLEFYSLGGIGQGVPIRTTVTDFGPLLLSKVLGLN